MSIRKNTLILNGPQYDALLAGVRLLAGALGEGMVNPDDGDVGDILTNSGEHPGLTASEVYDLGDAMQSGDLDANELPLLHAIATAALKVDIGAPSKSRLDAFRALSDALVTYNGAPLGFQGRLNPGGAPYPDAARQRDLAAESGQRIGWDLFEEAPGVWRIQREDDSSRFPDDAAAVAHVVTLALAGDKKAREALDLHRGVSDPIND